VAVADASGERNALSELTRSSGKSSSSPATARPTARSATGSSSLATHGQHSPVQVLPQTWS